MGIKRHAVLIAVFVYFIISFLYLKDKYNINAVEFKFRGDITLEEFSKLKNGDKYFIGAINYEMINQKSKIIMTTGYDSYFTDKKLRAGSFFSDIKEKQAVIGDKVADSFFRNLNILGNSINILGTDYEVIGIIKDSKDIYIPFQNSLIERDWQKKLVKFTVNDTKMLYYSIDTINSSLAAIGIYAYDIVIYKDIIDTYKNLAIIVMTYILIFNIIKLIKNSWTKIRKLMGGYKEKSRVFEVHQYIAAELRAVLRVLLQAAFIAGLLFLLLKSLALLSIPPSIVPDNLFSPSSYISIISFNYNRVTLRLEDGIGGIILDSFKLGVLFVLLVCTANIIKMWIGDKHSAKSDSAC